MKLEHCSREALIDIVESLTKSLNAALSRNQMLQDEIDRKVSAAKFLLTPVPHPPAPPYCATDGERKAWVLGWLEAEAAHGIATEQST